MIVETLMFPLYGKVKSVPFFRITIDNPKALVIYCHGNAETVMTAKTEIQKISDTYQVSVVAIEYQGYYPGKYPLVPTIPSINADAERIFQETTQGATIPIILMGRSIGTGIAGHLAKKFGCHKLIFITPLASISPELFKKELGIFGKTVASMIPNYYDNVSMVKNAKFPILLVVAAEDTILPIQHSKALTEANSSIKISLIDAGHNGFSLSDEEIREEIIEFLDET